MTEKKKRPVKIDKKPRTKLTPTKEERLKSLLSQRADNAETLARVKAEQNDLNAEILSLVEELDGADEVWEGEDINGRFHRATVVRPATTIYDVDYLRQNMSPKTWSSVTDEVLNVKALEDAVVTGRVSASVAMDARSVEPKKAYIKVTTK